MEGLLRCSALQSEFEYTVRSRFHVRAVFAFNLIYFLDVLGLEAHADEASGKVFEAWDAGGDAEGERWSDRASVLQGVREGAVGEDLHSLCIADGAFAIVLDAS